MIGNIMTPMMMKNCKNELSKRENWETGCSHGTQVRCQEEDQHIRQNHQRRQHIWWQCTSQQYIPEQRKLTAMNPIIVLTRYDMVSANGASSEPRCYKKSDGSQDVEGPQIYQMNLQTNSFQNMCDMLYAKIDSLARKIYSLQKKHLKIAYFGGHKSGLPDFGRPWTPNRWHQV